MRSYLNACLYLYITTVYVYPSAYLPIYPSVRLSVSLSTCTYRRLINADVCATQTNLNSLAIVLLACRLGSLDNLTVDASMYQPSAQTAVAS